MSLYQLVKYLILPPGNLILMFLVAIALGLRWPRLGLIVTCIATIVFYLLSAPFFANRFSNAVATIPALAPDADLSKAQAIVVLAAGATNDGGEYGGVMIDRLTLERLRYAAHLYHRTKLPVLVSGGPSGDLPLTLASAMKQALEEDFLVPVAWIEDRSKDTAENARFSTEILKNAGVSSIVLVTHASDMPRALALFDATGLTVTPAPTGFSTVGDDIPDDFLPHIASLQRSWMAMYEWFASMRLEVSHP